MPRDYFYDLSFIVTLNLLVYWHTIMVDQAEKDAKKKARAKELKKLRKAREKKKAEVSISVQVLILSKLMLLNTFFSFCADIMSPSFLCLRFVVFHNKDCSNCLGFSH